MAASLLAGAASLNSALLRTVERVLRSTDTLSLLFIALRLAWSASLSALWRAPRTSRLLFVFTFFVFVFAFDSFVLPSLSLSLSFVLRTPPSLVS